MNNLTKKLAIGTVQFGLKYGINNKVGAPTDDEIDSLLSYIYTAGISVLDTAYNYGNSELRIGRYLGQHPNSCFNLISKAPKGTNSITLEKHFAESLRRLQTRHLYGYLLHDFSDYETDHAIGESLSALKENGMVDKIGYSLYYPEQIHQLINASVEFDIVQIPYNLADRRFESNFMELRNRNVEVHIRSVFLQGLFFMDPNHLPNKLNAFEPFLMELHKLSRQYQTEIEKIALGYVIQNPFVNKVVLGVDTIDQMKKNVSVVNNIVTRHEITQIMNALEKIEVPSHLLVPSNWN